MSDEKDSKSPEKLLSLLIEEEEDIESTFKIGDKSEQYPAPFQINTAKAPPTDDSAIANTSMIESYEPRYHLWQNLDTGECELRPLDRSKTATAPSVQDRPSSQSDSASLWTMTNQPIITNKPTSSMQIPRLLPRSAEPLKKVRMVWSEDLQAAFEQAVEELGPNATPNPIRDRLHAQGFTQVTREHVSSHLQKHRYKTQGQEHERKGTNAAKRKSLELRKASESSKVEDHEEGQERS